MSLHLVTGHKGEAHITAEDQGAFNAGIFGDVDAILSIGEKCRASAITANTVRIYDGEIVMHGRHVRIARDTYVDVPIENGTQDMNRNDLIVVRYTKEADLGYENAEFVVLKGTETAGTATDPTPTAGDLLSEGCLCYDMPLYRVKLTGITVAAVERLAEVLPTMKEYIETVKPVKYGGTGKNTHTTNSVLVGNGASPLKNIVSKIGAFFSTGANAEPNFGTLPIECGGTGATTAAQALKNLGITVAASALNLLSGAKSNIQTQLDGKSDNGHTHDDRYFTESEVNTKLAGKSDTSHNHDSSYLKKYGLDAINIDDTSGNWTVDIASGGHGAVPELWVNVTQTTSGHFTIQTAIKCNKDTNTGRAAGKMWIRDKYTGGSGGDWSAWSQLATVANVDAVQTYANSARDEALNRIATLGANLTDRIDALEKQVAKLS